MSRVALITERYVVWTPVHCTCVTPARERERERGSENAAFGFRRKVRVRSVIEPWFPSVPAAANVCLRSRVIDHPANRAATEETSQRDAVWHFTPALFKLSRYRRKNLVVRGTFRETSLYNRKDIFHRAESSWTRCTYLLKKDIEIFLALL